MPTFGKTCLGLLAALAFSGTAAADITLPAPATQGGEGIFTVLNARHSAVPSDFPLKDITRQELANLLWAATGQNRNGNGWTVPFAMHRAPYNTLYVLMDTGVYRYDWQRNSLEEISRHDIRRARKTRPSDSLARCCPRDRHRLERPTGTRPPPADRHHRLCR